jgi:Ca-activated chloride channel homolog
MRFLDPTLAWWLCGTLAAVTAIRWAAHRRLGAASTAPWLFRTRAFRASILRRLPAAALVLSLLLLGSALLDPVLPYADVDVRSRGLDIVMAVDLSSSMEEQIRQGRATARPNETRLEAVREAIRTFVGRRHDDRIGLVVFSEHAYVISPLTFDHDYLLRYTDLIDDQLLRGEGMTAIGEGLSLSNYLLARQSARDARRNKVVVIFTDGENNTGREPLPVLAESDAANIRVHMIGVALEEQVKQKPQVRALLQGVRKFGGRYFDATTVRDLDAASRAIDAIEKGVLVSHTYQHDVPVYQWFALPSLLCLALAFALRALPPFVDQT